MKKLYGLIGYPLSHSFSARYFGRKFTDEGISDAEYRNFPIERIEDFPALVRENPELRGLNVTRPYKESVVSYLDELDVTASEIGAVNCIKVANGRLTGYNADAGGFMDALLELIGDERPDALVLGTGGAYKAVAYVLRELGIRYTGVSRNGGRGMLQYGDVIDEVIADNKLIINTTPLGTFPDVDSCPPLPYSALTPCHYLFDLVYNPEQTLFMEKGAERGAKTMNGYKMLVGQAERSWRIWNC